MESGLFLDIVVGQRPAILELLSSKDESLLIRGDPLLVLNLSLDVVNGIRGLDIKRDCLACKRLYEYLHFNNYPIRVQIKGKEPAGPRPDLPSKQTLKLLINVKCAPGQQMQKIFQQEKRIYKLADIRLEENIGGGGFGTVYKAAFKSNPAVKHQIASKFIEKKKIMESQQIEHLLSQLNALKEIQSPFKIEYFGLGENKDYIFLLTELVSGTNLYQFTFDQSETKRSLTALEVKFIASQLLSVIMDCHYHQYVYRDIKPQNIMINPSTKRIKLIDFGLSKKLAPGQRTYTFCGTPEYIAPQILSGSGHGYSVDWWSFGVLLYELTQGSAPFTSEKSPYQIYSKINVFSSQKGKIPFIKANSTLKGLILNLMQGDLSKRLGHNKLSASKHQYFRGVRMNQLSQCDSLDSFKKIMMK